MNANYYFISRSPSILFGLTDSTLVLIQRFIDNAFPAWLGALRCHQMHCLLVVRLWSFKVTGKCGKSGTSLHVLDDTRAVGRPLVFMAS